jgi:hypothetical protein
MRRKAQHIEKANGVKIGESSLITLFVAKEGNNIFCSTIEHIDCQQDQLDSIISNIKHISYPTFQKKFSMPDCFEFGIGYLYQNNR